MVLGVGPLVVSTCLLSQVGKGDRDFRKEKKGKRQQKDLGSVDG